MNTTQKVIDKFDGTKYKFLSNFYPCKFNYNGIEYSHSEGAFQAQKTLDMNERKVVAKLTASESKRACGKRGLAKLGFRVELRPDWESVKDQVMYEVVKAKFTQNPDLAQKLLETGDAELIEGTTWHDNYWGNCTCAKCSGITGRNQLGKTLMKVRQELKENK